MLLSRMLSTGFMSPSASSSDFNRQHEKCWACERHVRGDGVLHRERPSLIDQFGSRGSHGTAGPSCLELKPVYARWSCKQQRGKVESDLPRYEGSGSARIKRGQNRSVDER